MFAKVGLFCVAKMNILRTLQYIKCQVVCLVFRSVLIIRTAVFSFVTPCSRLGGYKYFGTVYYLHVHGH
jgi:hypothetical protein